MSVTAPTQMPMVPGDPRAIQNGIGFEMISRATRVILMNQLNDEIDRQADIWKNPDLALQQFNRDEGVGQIDIPHVELANFHEGPHESLIQAPPEKFPNLSVMAYMAVPALSQAFDQAQSSEITIFVESMQITGPVLVDLETAHESIVHRRIQRMTEAVARVMERNLTLMGTVHELRTPPRGGIGKASWLRPKSSGSGPRFLWHGSRLQYTATRHHSIH